MFSFINSNLHLSASVAIIALASFSADAAQLDVTGGSTADVNPRIFSAFDVLLDDGTLRFIGAGTISPSTITLNGVGGSFNANANDVLLNSNIVGTGNLTKSGAGTVRFWGMNT